MTTNDKINFIRQQCIEANPQGFGDRDDVRWHEKLRPIRIADVLLVMQKKGFGANSQKERKLIGETLAPVVYLLDYWNLRADDLRKQSDETINFLYELLQ